MTRFRHTDTVTGGLRGEQELTRAEFDAMSRLDRSCDESLEPFTFRWLGTIIRPLRDGEVPFLLNTDPNGVPNDHCRNDPPRV